MNSKLLFMMILVIIVILSVRVSGYTDSCKTTNKTYADGSMCFESTGVSNSSFKTAEECCKIPGQVWKF